MKKVFLIILATVLAGCASIHPPTPEQLAKETFPECPADYRDRIMTDINRDLFDPYSAIYRIGNPTKVVYNDSFVHTVFVAVNAKNRFGGYAGEQKTLYICYPNEILQPIMPLGRY